MGNIDFGEIYNNYLYKSRFDILKYFIKELYGSLKGKNVLEIGPGIGVFTEFFKKEEVGTYLGIDISDRAIKYLKEKYKEFSFINGDIANFRNSSYVFDLIFGADVLLHITDEDNYIKTLKNLCSQLDENGYMIFFDQIGFNVEASSLPHIIVRDINYIKRILYEEECEIVGVLPTTFFMNDPFDKNTLCHLDKIKDIFNTILYCNKNITLDDQQQHLLGEYLYLLDKLCLHKFKIGPSQKAIVIRKISNYTNLSFKIKEIWNKNYLKERVKQIKNSSEYDTLLLKNNIIRDLFNKINGILA